MTFTTFSPATGSRLLAVLVLGLVLSGCVTAPPKQTDDICAIFREKSGWYDATEASRQRWGVPIAVQMAIMHKESAFVGDARPPRQRLLWIIPWKRPSSAYGYSQALDSTWDAYKREAGRRRASRSDFADAADFIGWYVNKSRRVLGIGVSDAYSQYLAYHEGRGGYRRGSYRGKRWLLNAASRVAARAQRYDRQLATCREDLQ